MPPDYGTANPAVDAYLTFMGRVDHAYRDPAHVSASTFTNYLAGQARQSFETNFAQEKAQGKAVRGTAPVRRVRVTENHMGGSMQWAELRDCAADSASDPYTEYYVATGKPVPQKPQNPPGPYADTIKIFLINGQWTITQFTVDSTRTCKP